MNTSQKTSPIVISTVSTSDRSNLINNTAYNIRIRYGFSNMYSGISAPTSAITPRSVSIPTPTINDRLLNGYSAVKIFFTPPSSSGLIIHDYEYSTNGGTNYVSAGIIQSPYIITNQSISPYDRLENDTSYSIALRIRSYNDYSQPSTVSARPINAPGIPILGSVAGGVKQQIQITYSPPEENNQDISGYQYSINDGVTFGLPKFTDNPYIIFDNRFEETLTYNICIRAVNSLNKSSIPSEVIPVKYVNSLQPVPTLESATFNNNTITIIYTTIANATKYQYSINNAAYIDISGNANSYTFADLPDTTNRFTIRIRAGIWNALHGWLYSFVSNPITVKSSPPENVTAIGQYEKIYIYFTTPTDIPSGDSVKSYWYSTDGITYVDTSKTDSPIIITTVSSGASPRNKLTNYTPYSVRLKAQFSINGFSGVVRVNATPVGVTEIPIIHTIIPGYTEVQLFYSAELNFGVFFNSYEYSINGNEYISIGGDINTIINRLDSGNSYSIRIRTKCFRNIDGKGIILYSIASTPQTFRLSDNSPGIPSLVATSGDAKLQIQYSPPEKNAQFVTGYAYSIDNGRTFVDLSMNPHTI